MVRVALIGLGKMGISHLAIVRSHPDVEVVAVCDSIGYVLDGLAKYTSVRTYSDYKQMLTEEKLDAVVVSTPSHLHGQIVQFALGKGLHVFCEKPFCIDPDEGYRLAELATSKSLVNQVGYHYRFVHTFAEAKRLIDQGVIGRLHNIRAEAYGPVVLRQKNTTWRSSKSNGGGCLYDYACHAIDLVNYFAGMPASVGGTVLNSVFSADVDDEVYSTLFYEGGMTAQLAANWSDETQRKMSTKLTFWGTNGRLLVDRQEIQLYIRDPGAAGPPLKKGWSSIYTTASNSNTFFYLRGEEYSAQIDHFIGAIRNGNCQTRSTFFTATETDRVAAMMLRDSARPARVEAEIAAAAAAPRKPRRAFFLRRATAN